MVKQVEVLVNKNERLDKEVCGLLNATKNLERENKLLKRQLAESERGKVLRAHE